MERLKEKSRPARMQYMHDASSVPSMAHKQNSEVGIQNAKASADNLPGFFEELDECANIGIAHYHGARTVFHLDDTACDQALKPAAFSANRARQALQPEIRHCSRQHLKCCIQGHPVEWASGTRPARSAFRTARPLPEKIR
jgi:hypothetical protein